MVSRLLIANRGEIAVRIARTARRMGLSTVAVYSDSDAGAMHVAACDAAVRLGPPAPADSYLQGGRIVAAALATGAGAIHPGYGFLSENAGFAEAVLAAGLVWVGPPPEAIRAMGLKDAAKARMQAAGVPVVPGYHGEEQDPKFLAGCAEEIGYPVLIKARAGGGGKGMRRVERAEDFAEALEGARREAAAAFGDDAVLVEKFVATPRHIEVQVFADSHGQAVHLFERDCSLQRRHQKVIEEAPAPAMTPEMRAEMGAAAVRAAQAVGYVGAGTVEFIADASDGLRPDRFYFMEMNTRLQVEHPVTEAVTGLDLVEWQLRVAAGEPLPLTQEALRPDGWAVEARLYAEDPAQGFLPATGRLAHLVLPEGVRVDTGVRQGDSVSPHYDPMIAKIIAHAPDRAGAFARLAGALDRVEVAGCVTNAGFLARLARHPDVVAGRVDTGLIAREEATLCAEPEADARDWAVAAIAALGLDSPPVGAGPWQARDGWRAWGPAQAFADLVHRGATEAVWLTATPEGWQAVTPAGATRLGVRRDGAALWVESDGVVSRLGCARTSDGVTLMRDGAALRFRTVDLLARGVTDAAAGDAVRAPMPGLVKAVHVGEGVEVAAGDRLLTLEAMKMEHALRAPRAGRIASLPVAEGDQVEEGALLASLADD